MKVFVPTYESLLMSNPRLYEVTRAVLAALGKELRSHISPLLLRPLGELDTLPWLLSTKPSSLMFFLGSSRKPSSLMFFFGSFLEGLPV